MQVTEGMRKNNRSRNEVNRFKMIKNFLAYVAEAHSVILNSEWECITKNGSLGIME